MTSATPETEEALQLRAEGPESAPTLIYLPGLHGDWTLVTPFRLEIQGHVRWTEITYPRTLAWSLDDYARQILSRLEYEGITTGWLLAESFGSQVAWAIVRTLSDPSWARTFRLQGIILAGGFVEYPLKKAARWVARWRMTHPRKDESFTMWLYATVLKIRFRGSEPHRRAAEEFLERRTAFDARAMLHRINLLVANEPAPDAATLSSPIYYLTGLIDPIVPWFLVRRRLKQLCPTFRESAIIPTADHNVLGTAPRSAARTVLRWVRPS